MDMPERCADCKWCGRILKFCAVSEEFIEDAAIKPDWCPLRELNLTFTGGEER